MPLPPPETFRCRPDIPSGSGKGAPQRVRARDSCPASGDRQKYAEAGKRRECKGILWSNRAFRKRSNGGTWRRMPSSECRSAPEAVPESAGRSRRAERPSARMSAKRAVSARETHEDPSETKEFRQDTGPAEQCADETHSPSSRDGMPPPSGSNGSGPPSEPPRKWRWKDSAPALSERSSTDTWTS